MILKDLVDRLPHQENILLTENGLVPLGIFPSDGRVIKQFYDRKIAWIETKHEDGTRLSYDLCVTLEFDAEIHSSEEKPEPARGPELDLNPIYNKWTDMFMEDIESRCDAVSQHDRTIISTSFRNHLAFITGEVLEQYDSTFRNTIKRRNKYER